MDFAGAMEIIRNVILGCEGKEYDGILVKRLEASNTLDEGRSTNQTHIAISGEQMNMFPYLRADGYFDCDYEERDEQLKKYFIPQVSLSIYKDNVEYLSDGENRISFDGSESRRVLASIVRSRRRSQADQVQLSLTTMDDPDFVAFRKLLHAGAYLVILKHREKLLYDCFGIKAEDEARGDYRLSVLNNKFYKLPTNTKVDISKIVVTSQGEKSSAEEPDTILRKTGAENILLYGVPGAGKSHEIRTKYCSDENYMERVVFHPDYMYSDFVGQIQPRILTDGENNSRLGYVFVPGPFTKILKKAEQDPEHYYYLVIEELNRGNAPALFGEIFQLLDRKDEEEYPAEEAGESVYGIASYDVAQEVYGDEKKPVRIPSNLFVLATMNTADQNVFTLDTAFQRRWTMRQIENNFDQSGHSADRIEGTKIDWGTFATVINDMVIDNNADMVSSEDKRLGVYFVKKRELTADRFPQKVLKYLWDDAFKLDKTIVFRESCRSMEEITAAYASAVNDRLEAVLQESVYQKMLSRMQQKQEAGENQG